MFLDEEGIEIIANAAGFDDTSMEMFKDNYNDAMSNYVFTKVIGYMAEHDPEKAQEIDKMFLSREEGKRIKAPKIMIDQLKLYLASYQDLEEEIKDALREYDNALFFHFLKKGPKEDVFKLLDHLSAKIKRLDNYQKAVRIAKERFDKKEVDEFFEKDDKNEAKTETE
ncbi:hypothetical protein GF389_06000 [Candidatus Dojkabacteria bacterium]|nr:hypothetical protein [Candidatus Dojkabacteria bacterium]